jgi:predicted component of type VI protein secretion system
VLVEEAAEITIGRKDPRTGESPEVDLSSLGDAAQSVSRKHVMVSRQQGMLRIMDLGSANFTWLNGQKMSVGQPRLLRADDELRLGELVMTVSFSPD